MESNDVVNPSPTDVSARQPLPPQFVRGEIRLHSLFFAMAAVVILMSLWMRSEGETAVYLPGFQSPLPDTCSSRRLLGVDCPGCGMTRAFISISRGQFSKAWHLNHASFAVYFFVAVQIPWHTIQIWRLRNNRPTLDWPFIYLAPILIVVLLTINWILTLYRTFSIT